MAKEVFTISDRRFNYTEAFDSFKEAEEAVYTHVQRRSGRSNQYSYSFVMVANGPTAEETTVWTILCNYDNEEILKNGDVNIYRTTKGE